MQKKTPYSYMHRARKWERKAYAAHRRGHIDKALFYGDIAQKYSLKVMFFGL